MCGLIHYKHEMLIIGTLDKFVQSMYHWDEVQNVLFLSLSFQTIQLFNEYNVDIFNNYKGSDKNTNSEYIITKAKSISNLKWSGSYKKVHVSIFYVKK